MTEVEIPDEKLATVRSSERIEWIVDSCPHAVVGRINVAARFAVVFADVGEAEAFRQRWLVGS